MHGTPINAEDEEGTEDEAGKETWAVASMPQLPGMQLTHPRDSSVEVQADGIISQKRRTLYMSNAHDLLYSMMYILCRNKELSQPFSMTGCMAASAFA